MAKKKKRNSKAKKVQRTHKSECLVVNSVSSGMVAVPDCLGGYKRRQQGCDRTFVNASCIHSKISSPLILVKDTPDDSVCHYQSPGRKRRAVTSRAPFVPNSCITNSTTPVIHFNKQPALEKSQEATIRTKRVRNNNSIAFVSESCLTNQVSLPYLGIEPSKSPISYIRPIELPKAYDVVLEMKPKRHKKSLKGVFVPASCITTSTTPVYRIAETFQPQPLVNPYPELPGLAPAIISAASKGRDKSKGSATFVPISCVTNQVAKVSSGPDKERPVPVAKYQYVDRPNSPDIQGPQIKKIRKKRNNVVAFVPKSCTVEERLPTKVLQKGEALAKEAPTTPKASEAIPQENPGINRLPMIMFIAVLMGLIYYLMRS